MIFCLTDTGNYPVYSRIGNPNVTDILFSDTGAGGRHAINLENEALLKAHTHDPAKRRVLREIINKAEYRLGKEALLLRRLPLIDIDKLLTIYECRDRIRELLGLHEPDVIDKIVKFFY